MLARRRTNMEARDWTTARAIQHKLINCISTAPSDLLLPVLSLSCVRERAYNERDCADSAHSLYIWPLGRSAVGLRVWAERQPFRRLSANSTKIVQQLFNMMRECHLGQVWCFAIPHFPEFAIRGIQEQPATRPLPLGQPLALGLLKENAIVFVSQAKAIWGRQRSDRAGPGEGKRHCFWWKKTPLFFFLRRRRFEVHKYFQKKFCA